LFDLRILRSLNQSRLRICLMKMINKTNRSDVLVLDEIGIPLHIQTKRKLHLSFRFIDGVLFVSAPLNVSTKDIQEALLKKKKWLIKHHALSINRMIQPDEIRLFGQKRSLHFMSGRRFSYVLEETELMIFHPTTMKQENALKRFKVEFSDVILPTIFESVCQEMNCRPSALYLKDTKSSHGRCNSQKEITLSRQLISMSEDYIRYVCIHELAHLKQMNHSKAFYALVTVYCPNYKKLIANERSIVL